jgi:hypothetical protein
MSGLAQIKYQVLEKGGSQRNTTISPGQARDVLAVKVQELKPINEALHAENAERRLAQDGLRRSESYLLETQRLSHVASFGRKVSAGEIFWSAEAFCAFQYAAESKT